MSIRLTAADINYLLQQVRIGINYSQLASPLDPGGVREVNGANNNLIGAYDEFGNYTPGANPLGGMTAADTDFLRLSYTVTPGAGDHGTTYPTITLNNPMAPGSSFITDGSVRMITNLISSSVIDPTSPIYNPAAVAAMNAAADGAGDGAHPGGYAVDVANSVIGATQGAFMGDQGILGGGTFNEYFTAFGQFFDHGLDFISKGGGYVAITIPAGDPLYVDPSDPAYVPGASNVMYLNRAALSNPASDFNPDGTLKDGVTPQFNNNTGYLVDQSQTYGSHAAVNAILRQYDSHGRPTGSLITGAEDGKVTTVENGLFVAHSLDPNDASYDAALAARAPHDLATWSDLKANALRIGVVLTDADALNLPALRVDATGNLLYHPDGSQWTTDIPAGWTGLAGQSAADPFVRHEDGTVVYTNQAILADLAPGANPHPGPGEPPFNPDLLAIHFVSGDGRVNENVGLTSVHHVFHEEHNYEAQNIEHGVLAAAADILAAAAGGTPAEIAAANAAAAAYINAWTRSDGATAGGSTQFDWTDDDGVAHSLTVSGVRLDNDTHAIAWDGNAIYQAARIITEQEYNHIAINDYTRSLAVYLPEFVSYGTDVHPNVSLEFSQAIFRLGHSMLTEQLHFAVADSQGRMPGDVGYVETFGATDLFNAFLNPAMYQDTGPGAIALGLLREQANQIDEFVTPALQQTLLGAPLDLAALNLARGRDVGLPTLNELRQQIYEGLVAYNSSNSGSALAPYTSWQDFGANLRTAESLVNFIAAYGRDDSGYHWGLTEARAHYLAGDTGLLVQRDPTTGEVVLDGNGDPVMVDRVWTIQDVRDAAQKIIDAYGNAADPHHDDAVAFMEGAPTYNTTTHQWDFGQGDQGFWDIDLWIGGLAEHPTFDGPLGTTFTYVMLDFGQRLQDGDRFYYFYRMPAGQNLGDELISHTFSEMIERTTGLEHLGGAFATQTGVFTLDSTGALTDVDANADINDYFNASQHQLADGTPANLGHIIVAGGDGNDYIVGGFGDDYLYGDAGDDVLQGGQGNDNILGGDGDDWIYDDENDDTINGGRGNDHIFAGTGVFDLVFGGEGDDDLHGGDGIDEVHGDDGDDAVWGEGDTDLLFGGNGNDFMDGGDGVDEMFGGNGNDWMRGGVGDDNINGGSGNDLMEGGLGATANDGDRLNGDSPLVPGQTVLEFNGDGTEGDLDIASYEDVEVAIVANLQDANANGTSSTLMDTYAYVEGLVGSAQNDKLTGADADTSTSNGPNNYLIGGGGNDILTGLGGDDFIFGDSVVVDNSLYWIGDARHAATGQGAVTGQVTQAGEVRPTFQNGSLGHILGDAGAAGGQDVAVYRGLYADYHVEQVTIEGITAYRVTDLRSPANTIDPVTGVNTFDGTDVLVGIEQLQFADRTVSLIPPAVSISDVSQNEGNGSGFSQFGFTVSLDHAYALPVTITYSTADGTATAGSDYTARVNQTVTIAAGQTSATINIPVVTDAVVEPNETFFVNLTAASNGATIADAQGLGTIVNDDVAAVPITDIVWDGKSPADSGNFLNPNGFPNILSSLLGTLSTVGGAAGSVSYSLASGSSSGFAVGLAGSSNVNLTSLILGNNANYTLNITAAQGGSSFTETFKILSGTSGNNALNAGNANDTIIYGGVGNDTISGGARDDTLFGQGGNDTFNQSSGGGHDVIDGGSGNDSYVLTGDASAETFRIYSAAAWAALGAGHTLRDAGSGIVITRNGTTDAAVVAELRNIEEIRINGNAQAGTLANGNSYTGAASHDTVQVIGNFVGTGLAYNTITVNGTGGDTVDISQLSSDHRVVLNSVGGSVVGDTRPQDVVNGVTSGASTGSGDPGGLGDMGGHSGRHAHAHAHARLGDHADGSPSLASLAAAPSSATHAPDAHHRIEFLGSARSGAVHDQAEHMQTGGLRVQGWRDYDDLDHLLPSSLDHHHDDAPTGRGDWFNLT